MGKKERKWGKMKESGEMGTAPAPSSPVLRGRWDGIYIQGNPSDSVAQLNQNIPCSAEAAGGAGLSKAQILVGFGCCWVL